MNIMIITSMFPPIKTGSSHYAHDLAVRLSERGNRVSVVTLKNSESTDHVCDFPVYRLPAIHLENLFKRYFKHFRVSSCFIDNYFRVDKLIKENKIDAIFLASHYHDIGLIAAVSSARNKVPLVCSVNTQLQSINPATEKIFNFIDKLVCGKMILPFCRKIVSLDVQVYAYLKDVHGRAATDKSVLIPYGVHGDTHYYLDHHHDYGLHNQLIGVGSVIEQRNFLSAIMIFNLLLKTFPHLTFKIIGHVYYDAPVKLVKELGIGDKVLFMGELPHDAVIREVKNSDLYMGIVSGKYPGLGTAALETMLMGVPVVSNVPSGLFGDDRLEDMRHYIYADIDYRRQNADRVNGNMDPPAGIVEKIARVLKDEAVRRHIGEGGRQFVAENLGWERIAGKVEDLFSALIEKNK